MNISGFTGMRILSKPKRSSENAGLCGLVYGHAGQEKQEVRENEY
jgi:hypothetical protein